MQANFSALYHGCSLKTILDFFQYQNKQVANFASKLSHFKRPLPAIADKGLGLSNSFSLSS